MSSLHVDVVGRGPPMVLLHGWAMHGGIFAPLVERLADAHTLHVVDLPGHGHSRDAATPFVLPALADAVRAVVPAQAVWCGWSLGGLVALQAARDGAAMPALIQLCSSPRFVIGQDWLHGMAVDTFGDFAAGLRTDWKGTLARFIALEAFGSDHHREDLQSLQQGLFARGEPAPAVLADGLRLLEQSDLRADAAALPVPTLWLAGRRDRVVDPRAVAAAAALTPNASHAVIAQAGHAPFLTHAGTVAGVIAAFLAGTRA